MAAPLDLLGNAKAIYRQLTEGAIATALVPTPTTPTIYRAGVNAVTANDVLAAPTLGTATAQTGGSLTAVAHHIRVAAVNACGRTTVSTPAGSPVTPSASGAIRIPITVDPLATHYDVFLSTAADPLFVARVTAAQVTAGCIVTTAATAATSGALAAGTAGTVEVRVLGTGPAASTAAQNTAYVLPSNATPVDCTGKELAYFDIQVELLTRWTEPTLTLIPFFNNATAAAAFAGEPITLSFGGAVAGAIGSLRQRISVNCAGNNGVSLLVQNLTGAVATVSIWSATR